MGRQKPSPMLAMTSMKRLLDLMRCRYSTLDPTQSELDSLPWLPLRLVNGQHDVEAIGLVDSGATVNVLPYDLGTRLGADWEDQQAVIRLSGSLGDQPAMPLFVIAHVGDFQPVRLAFAWTKAPHAPLVLGQMNFFIEFDVCFYRAKLEFEINAAKK